MGNGVMKGTKTLGPVWAGSERSGGERSEPPRMESLPKRRRARRGGLAGIRKYWSGRHYFERRPQPPKIIRNAHVDFRTAAWKGRLVLVKKPLTLFTVVRGHLEFKLGWRAE